jgi:hypothetical protein
MLTCDERIWMIENYRNLGGVIACINDWPFESAKKSHGLTVWAAIGSAGIIGPYFFHSEPLEGT